ncbi:MAG: hypothetical protein EOS73_16145 [Mesorhizobium sp.]|uniref:hypothetical protein n=1 Tax=Mesorhizobium sp. M7A.F.Ca.ET.027.02.1.1 TaxID=2496655 RepID=UPI000FD2CF95|nr:hypothetical protein [Mesorhizobium sp. M7A.F.Ca.ET.027.02.1.1]RVD14249.1 hypothetical protein EN749_20400 [Mesorhizobium sp. M7A.F.Ca.ET.027.02.1.1]RWD08209.1 MAG: hypothetical protein EOS73_16145 [Mesorhizobium sp.]
MSPRLSSPALADRGARLAGVGFTERLVPRQAGAVDYEFPAAPVPQEPDRAEPAAPSAPLPGGAAFSRFTESSSVGARDVGESAPAVDASSAGAPDLSRNAILLPDHVMVLVRAVAAYERCTNQRAVALALTEYATMIGAGVLARAMADLDDDLAEVPAHARRAANRFRGGGP